ncbi:MAG: hypothetical protein J7K40_14380 [candidate division Zixibacteria bacterium]|nr:hypothetical protein [candidate division Zixibacteria bacterium]
MIKTAKAFDIREIWQLLVKFKWYLIIPVIIVPLAAILATFFIQPVYESSTSILIDESNILPPSVQRGLEMQVYRRLSTADIKNAMSNQIRSTKYIKSLIAKLDIPIPEWIRASAASRAANLPGVSAAELSENILVQTIREQIGVEMSGSNIVTITVQSALPVMAHKMTLTLAEIFLEESLAKDLAGIQGSISFTEEQLAVYREKLYNAQNKLKRFRQNMIVVSVDEDTTTLNRNLNAIFSAVEAIDIDISEAENEKSDIELILRLRGIEPNTINLPENIKKQKNQLMNTIPRLAELLGRYSWRDAKVVALNQETRDIITSIGSEIQLYVDKAYVDIATESAADLSRYLILETNIEFMRTKISAMQKSIGKIKSRLSRDPAVEVTMDRLQSEVDRYRELYQLFVQHSQYAAIDQSAKKVEAQSKFMIVQPAVMPLGPISPNRSQMILFGIILGIMIGSGAILILMMLDDSFKKVEDVEEYLNLSVIATIPRISTPYTIKRKDRALIYIGFVVSILLAAAIIYMKFKNG